MDDLDSNKSIVIGTQLRRARELLQLTPEEVASELNIHSKNILDWEKERLQPNLKQLEQLAEHYGRGIDYFLRETPAPPEKIEFRGKPGQSFEKLSKETRIVLARFDELCRTAVEFESLLNKRQEVKLLHFKESDQPKTVAQILRREFDINDKPLLDLRNRLENVGVRIFELPVAEDAFSGFSFWHQEYGPCILLDAKESRGRRNFTLAHELAHLLYNHGSSLCYIHLKFYEPQGGLEYRANQVAIELLLPESGVVEDYRKRNLPKRPQEKELVQMSSKWGVSAQALGYRLENLGMIHRGLMDQIIESKPKHFRRPKTPTWERQLGKRFIETSIEAYQKNIISIGKLAEVWRIPIRKVFERVEHKGE